MAYTVSVRRKIHQIKPPVEEKTFVCVFRFVFVPLSRMLNIFRAVLVSEHAQKLRYNYVTIPAPTLYLSFYLTFATYQS